MANGLKWLAGVLALCFPLTAFAHASDCAYFTTLADHRSSLTNIRPSEPLVPILEIYRLDLKKSDWLMTRASSPIRRRGKP